MKARWFLIKRIKQKEERKKEKVGKSKKAYFSKKLNLEIHQYTHVITDNIWINERRIIAIVFINNALRLLLICYLYGPCFHWFITV